MNAARRHPWTVRWLTGVAALAAGAALLAPVPAAAAGPKATHLVAHAGPPTAYRSSVVTVTGTAKPAVPGLTISLQRYDGHRWVTVTHVKETRTGAFSLRVKAAGKPGPLVLRVVRAATRTAKAGVGANLHVRVVTAQFTVKAKPAAAQAPYGGPIVVTGTVAAKTTGGVMLQRLVAGQWTTLATTRLTKKSAFAFSTVQPGGGYVLRVYKPWTTKVAGGVSKRFTVTVTPMLSVTPPALPAGATHLAYTGALAAQGGVPPYTWSLAAGILPPGVSLSTAGVLSGRPSLPSITALTVAVHDAAGHTATAATTFTVAWSAGTVSGWGTNDVGQLADGIRPDRDTATQVTGLSGASVVVAGLSTAYALVSGGVQAWGIGDNGQLGNGTTGGYTATPVPVTGLGSGVTSIAAKESTAFALKSDGTVWGWGSGAFGQLGNGTTADSSVPVQVSGLTGVTRIAATGAGGYALKADGTVWAWGDNSVGQIGDGSLTMRPAAVQVSGVTSAAGVWAGYGQAYAVKSDQTVYAWGSGTDGELGNGASADATVAVKVTIAGVLALGGGGGSGYAVLSDHTVRAWGANESGELGDGTTVGGTLPVTVSGLAGISILAAGASTAYALRSSDGTVWSWGREGSVFRQRGTAGAVTGLGPVVAVETDPGGGVAVKADGTVWDWGNGYLGRLGDGTTDRQTDVPVQVSGLAGVVAVAGNYPTRLALRGDGTVWAWGDNQDGEFGVASASLGSSSVPLQVPGITGATSISTGARNVYATKADGTVWAWGSGLAGTLGNGAFADSATPVQVLGLTGIITVVGGEEDGYALAANGTVYAWGAGDLGQLGHTALLNISVPAAVPGLSGVVSIAAGGDSAYAVRSDGSAVAWGDNTYGQLGNGSQTNAPAPVAVAGVTSAHAVAAAYDNSYLLLDNGTVLSAGHGLFAEIGDGATADRSTPVAVTGLTGVIAVTAGGSVALVLRQG